MNLSTNPARSTEKNITGEEPTALMLAIQTPEKVRADWTEGETLHGVLAPDLTRPTTPPQGAESKQQAPSFDPNDPNRSLNNGVLVAGRVTAADLEAFQAAQRERAEEAEQAHLKERRLEMGAIFLGLVLTSSVLGTLTHFFPKEIQQVTDEVRSIIKSK